MIMPKLTWYDVFNSQRVWPKNYNECREIAKNTGFSYLAFNGSVYSVNEDDIRKPICEIKDLEEK